MDVAEVAEGAGEGCLYGRIALPSGELVPPMIDWPPILNVTGASTRRRYWR